MATVGGAFERRSVRMSARAGRCSLITPEHCDSAVKDPEMGVMRRWMVLVSSFETGLSISDMFLPPTCGIYVPVLEPVPGKCESALDLNCNRFRFGTRQAGQSPGALAAACLRQGAVPHSQASKAVPPQNSSEFSMKAKGPPDELTDRGCPSLLGRFIARFLPHGCPSRCSIDAFTTSREQRAWSDGSVVVYSVTALTPRVLSPRQRSSSDQMQSVSGMLPLAAWRSTARVSLTRLRSVVAY